MSQNKTGINLQAEERAMASISRLKSGNAGSLLDSTEDIEVVRARIEAAKAKGYEVLLLCGVIAENER